MDYVMIAFTVSLFVLAILFGIDLCRDVRRGRPPRPKGVHGRIRLYDADGKPLLSARLPASGLRKLLDDHQKGRLG